jgi:hypothetical protein
MFPINFAENLAHRVTSDAQANDDHKHRQIGNKPAKRTRDGQTRRRFAEKCGADDDVSLCVHCLRLSSLWCFGNCKCFLF